MAGQNGTTLPFHEQNSAPVEPNGIQPSMTLREAGPIWLESRRPFISETTQRDYHFYLKRIYESFNRIRLEHVTADSIREHQRSRLARGVGAAIINHECSTLQQLLKRVNLWHKISRDYQPIPLPKGDTGRALSEEEEQRLFGVASLNPNWEVTYNVALLSAHTAAGPGEIRHLDRFESFPI
jgi:hypothetical protein